MPSPLLLVAGVVVGALVGALVAYLWVGNRNRERDLVSNAEREKLLSDAETQMKEMVLEAKEEAHRIRLSLEQEVRDARAELQRSERRVQQKEESIDRKLEDPRWRTDRQRGKRKARAQHPGNRHAADCRRANRRDLGIGGGNPQRRDEGAHHRSGGPQHSSPRTRDRGRPDHRRHTGGGHSEWLRPGPPRG